MGAGGALGGPARPGGNFGGKTANLGAAPHDWGFAKKKKAGNDNTFNLIERRSTQVPAPKKPSSRSMGFVGGFFANEPQQKFPSQGKLRNT